MCVRARLCAHCLFSDTAMVFSDSIMNLLYLISGIYVLAPLVVSSTGTLCVELDRNELKVQRRRRFMYDGDVCLSLLSL